MIGRRINVCVNRLSVNRLSVNLCVIRFRVDLCVNRLSVNRYIERLSVKPKVRHWGQASVRFR